MRPFTRDELRQYTGRDGMPALIAHDGAVYDVSASFLWQDGRHQALHSAGADLTPGMADAPHGDDVLKAFPVVGMLVDG
jgi:predicted heme/steroid binding protein